MPTKKVTGGFVTVSKAGKVGTKVFTTKATAEKVQRAARKNLGKTRGGKAAAKPKSKGSKGNPTPAATETKPKRPPRVGAIYQTTKVMGQAAMPLTDYALTPGPKTADGLIAHARSKANAELAKGYVVAAVDAAASKHRLVGHAGALSRKSATAIAPEAFLVLTGVGDVRDGRTPREIHQNAAITTTGYHPVSGVWRSTPARFRIYHKLKWIGAGVRMAANRTKLGRSISEPIRKGLRMLGGTI